LDKFKICDKRENWAFATIAEQYRVIDDYATPVVCENWSQKVKDLGKSSKDRLILWCSRAQKSGVSTPHNNDPLSVIIRGIINAAVTRPNRWVLNLVSLFSANLFLSDVALWQKAGLIREEGGLLIYSGGYDNEIGIPLE
jgi:hypothetical protein